MATWVPAIDQSIVFEGGLVSPSSISASNPSPRQINPSQQRPSSAAAPHDPKRSLAMLQHTVSKVKAEQASLHAFPTAARARTDTLRPHIPAAGHHFETATEQAERKLPDSKKNVGNHFSMHFKGEATIKGVFKPPPAVKRPVIDFSSSERPWNSPISPTKEQYMDKSIKQPTSPIRHRDPASRQKKSEYSFGSSTPRKMAVSSATHGDVFFPLTADHITERTPQNVLLVHKDKDAKGGVVPRYMKATDSFDHHHSLVDVTAAMRSLEAAGGIFKVDFEELQREREARRERESSSPSLQQTNKQPAYSHQQQQSRQSWQNLVDTSTSTSSQIQSERWSALTLSLYFSLALEPQVPHPVSLQNYVQVMEWRVSGMITADEFTAITNEYRAKWKRSGRKEAAPAESNGASSPPKSRWGALREKVVTKTPTRAPVSVVSLAAVRKIFSETPSSTLDIYVALCINERNRSLAKNGRVPGTWLASVQQCWFSLDTKGYGWCTGEDAVNVAWSLCKLEGVRTREVDGIVSGVLGDIIGNTTDERRGVITLASFQKWCMKRGVGEEEVKALLAEARQTDKGKQGRALWAETVKENVRGSELERFLLQECGGRCTEVCLGGDTSKLASEISEEFRKGRIGGGGKDVIEQCLMDYGAKIEQWFGVVWGDRDADEEEDDEDDEVELVTPIQHRFDASRNILSVATNHSETPQAKKPNRSLTPSPKPGSNKASPEYLEASQQQARHQKKTTISAPLSTVISASGDFGEAGREENFDAAELNEKLAKCEWKTVWVNESAVAPVRAAAGGGGRGGGGEGADEEKEKESLERLVDSLLQSNDLSILDDLRRLRQGHDGVSPGPPPPPPEQQPESPNSTMTKKSRRGSDLLGALRALTPTREKGGQGAGGLAAVMKLGLDFNKDDGVDVHHTPVLQALRGDEMDGKSELKL
jgi:hypothetical protein